MIEVGNSPKMGNSISSSPTSPKGSKFTGVDPSEVSVPVTMAATAGVIWIAEPSTATPSAVPLPPIATLISFPAIPGVTAVNRISVSSPALPRVRVAEASTANTLPIWVTPMAKLQKCDRSTSRSTWSYQMRQCTASLVASVARSVIGSAPSLESARLARSVRVMGAG